MQCDDADVMMMQKQKQTQYNLGKSPGHYKEAEKQRLDEVETLRKNMEDLKLKLKEAIDAHDQTVLATKERELKNELLVRGLSSEAERVNEAILGTECFSFSSSFVCGSLHDLVGLMCRLLS